MVQLGEGARLQVRDEQFKDWLTALRKEQNLEDDRSSRARLKQEGMTIDDLRKNVEKQFMISQVQREEVGSKLTITEEEARQYYLGAHAGVHRAGQRDAARDPDRESRPAPRTARRHQRRGGRRGAGAGDGDTRADPGRRGLRQGGRRSLERGVEVDRRSDRADQRQRALRAAARAAEDDEAGRGDAADRGRQGIPDPQARNAQGNVGAAAFESVRDLVAERVHTDRQRQEVRKFLGRVRGQAIIEWKNAELKKAYDDSCMQEIGETGPVTRALV